MLIEVQIAVRIGANTGDVQRPGNNTLGITSFATMGAFDRPDIVEAWSTNRLLRVRIFMVYQIF